MDAYRDGTLRPVELIPASQPAKGTWPACSRAGALSFLIDENRLGQWFALLFASSRVRNTASKLNEAGFWRGGNFTKFSIWLATSPCI